MRTTQNLLVLTVCLCLSLTVSCAHSAGQNVPLPSDVRLTPPADALPADVRTFAGKWTGSWDGTLDHVLIVEEIASPKKITAIYAWGTAPNWNINKPGFTRVRGKIVGGKLEIRLRNGAAVTYAQTSPDELRGEYELSGTINQGTFKRVRE